MKDYVQELLATLVESIVEMYELPSGDMNIKMGADLATIGDSLSALLNEFIEVNTK